MKHIVLESSCFWGSLEAASWTGEVLLACLTCRSDRKLRPRCENLQRWQVQIVGNGVWMCSVLKVKASRGNGTIKHKERNYLLLERGGDAKLKRVSHP